MDTLVIRGADLIVGDVIHSGHDNDDPITVVSFAEYNGLDGWFIVCGDDDNDHPFYDTEDVRITKRETVADAIAFRRKVREIMHAADSDSDLSIIEAVRSAHLTDADLNGCPDCD